MLISSNFASKTRWSIFTLGHQMYQANPGYNKLFLYKDNFIDNERNYKVCKSTITNTYIKGGHFSIQIQVSDLEKIIIIIIIN